MQSHGRGDFAGFHAAHAIGQEDESRLVGMVEATLSHVVDCHGVFVAASDHSNRRPRRGVDANAVQIAAARIEPGDQFLEAGRVGPFAVFGRKSLGDVADERLGQHAGEERIRIGDALQVRAWHAGQGKVEVG